MAVAGPSSSGPTLNALERALVEVSTSVNDFIRLHSEWFMYHQACLPIIGHAWQDYQIDLSTHVSSIRGLRALRSAVNKELQWVEKHSADVGRDTIFASSNAFYLTTSWQHILYSALHESPITELDSLKPTGIKSNSNKSAKVDIVCQGGKKWIRLSTIKPLSLLSEFRNAESYVVDDDEDSSSSSGEEDEKGPKLSLDLINSQLANGEVDGIASQCSIMKMARELQKAADVAEKKSGWGRPMVEVALTRLGLDDMLSSLQGKFYDEDEKNRFEARIRAMLVEMENMQITALLKNKRQLYDVEEKRQYLPSSIASGEASQEERITSLPQLPSPPKPKAASPTTTLNLDLSALVAFVSQISHMPLSNFSSTDDVDACFRKDHWKLATKFEEGGILDGEKKSAAEEPLEQTEAEKNHHTQHARALGDQLRREMTSDSFFDAILDNLEEEQRLSLVCTEEAAEKFTEILSLVGGPTEQRRARNLLEEHGQDEFWRGSRWESRVDVRQKIILPVRPVSFSAVGVSSLPLSTGEHFERLAKKSVQQGLKELRNPTTHHPVNNSNIGTGVQRQTPHTLASILYGLVNGRTTLTTNIASIKWLVRDINRYEVAEASIKGLSIDGYLAPFASAVLFYPRSLAEKMMTSKCLASVDCEPQTPLDWSGDTARDDVRLVPFTPNEAAFDDAVKSAQSESFQDKSLVGGSAVQPFSAPIQSNKISRGFRATKRWLRGPRPRSVLVIRHFRWWPLQPVEEAWLKLTSPLAWKDPNLVHRTAMQDVEEQQTQSEFRREEEEGEGFGGDHSSIRRESDSFRDWKINKLHWIALALTFIAWAFGFTFLVKNLWYEASVKSSDGSGVSPSFFGCTTTFWTANSLCGLDGTYCSPFSSSTPIPFRCPASCETTTLGGPRAVGDQLPSYTTLVVGGGHQGNSTSFETGDAIGPYIYRGDSFICSAAVHAGAIRSDKGGCSSIWLSGAYSGFQGIERNGIQSTPFNSSFPVSFYFDDGVQGEKCTDRSSRGYILDVILLAWVGFVLQPKRIVYFFTLVVVGFWHINFISEPREYPMSVGDPMGDFLPTLFVAYGLWRLTFRYVWPAFERLPIERNIWIQGFFWIGVLLNLVFANIPLNRLVASDISSQPGALTALIVIIVIVIVIALNQIRVIRKVGKLPKFLTLTIIAGIILGLLAAIPTTGFRLHHYIIAMCLLPYTAFPTRLSLIYSAFLLGMFLNGVGRWGYDGIIQDVATIRGSGIIGTGLPSFLASSDWTGVADFGGASNSSGLIHWQDVPSNQSDQWDSFQLLVDDVLRLQSTETFFNISQLSQYYLDTSMTDSTTTTSFLGMLPTSNLSIYPMGNDSLHIQQVIASQPHYLRLAYYNTNTAYLGDFTEAATLFFNGTFVPPQPGAT